MGYAFIMGPCFGCKRPFHYNPNRVPSIRINGILEPICLSCVTRVNPQRIKYGLQPIIPHADAYEPIDESEL